jgi:hypothetical protein
MGEGAMNLVLHRCLRRSQLVEELVEAWRLDRGESGFMRELQGLVQECLDLANVIRDAWKSAQEMLIAGEITDLTVTAEILGVAAQRTVQMFAEVRKLITAAEQKGNHLENVGMLEDADRYVKKLSNSIRQCVPPYCANDVQNSLAAYHRGESQPIEELLNAAKS